jgi:prepilin-type N-terminal cleavage/methylation domain-containing protein
MKGRLNPNEQRGVAGDAGFSLIELVVVLVVMPIIIGAIAMGMVAVFHLQSSTGQRLSGSVDLQKVSAQYVKDVQNAEQVYLGTTPQECGAAGVQLLGLGWNGINPNTNLYNTMVSYVRVASVNNSTDYQLERLYCTLGNMTTPVATNVLSSDFYLTSGLLTQSPPAVCATTLTDCSTAAGAYSAHNIAAVTFTMYVPMSSAPYSLIASPRGGSAGIPSSTPFTLTSPLTLLGNNCSSGGGVLSVGNGTLNIQVQGQDGVVPGTLGVANCSASSITLANKGSINASGVLTGLPSTSGISVGANPGSYPTQVNYNSGMCNPFQPGPGSLPLCPNATAIVAPSTSTTCGPGTGVTCQSAVCNQVSGVYQCPAGIYPTAPSFPNNSTINFATSSSPTVFGTDFTVPNGSNITFGSGVYVFAANDPTAFTTGTSKQQNSGVSVYGSGVLFYVPSGGMTFSNNSLISLTGIASANTLGLPYYDGVTIWLGGTQATPTTSASNGVLTLGNNSTQTNNYGGIYVPYGGVVDSNNGTIGTTFLVASWAIFSNGLTVTVTAP